MVTSRADERMISRTPIARERGPMSPQTLDDLPLSDINKSLLREQLDRLKLLYSSAEARALLSCSQTTIDEMVRLGLLQRVNPGGLKMSRITGASIAALIVAGVQHAQARPRISAAQESLARKRQ